MTRRPNEALRGDVIEGGVTRAHGWEWSEVGGPRRGDRLPWFGIFLLVFGGILLLRQAFPALEQAGSLLFLAVGLAFLVSWVVNRRTGSLYLGAIITALAAPGILEAAGILGGPGVGTFCLGVAFLAIAGVRGASRGGVGWQAALGVILIAIGGTSIVLPGIGDLVWPLLLVGLGAVLLFRASAART